MSVLAIAILCPGDLIAQSSPASALSRIEKGNWIKAEQQLRKALKKDTLNSEARYVYSILFFSEGYPKKNIDSAYHYSLASLSDFQKSSLRQKERIVLF
jgi:Tfp pilus assembly protein PilF